MNNTRLKLMMLAFIAVCHINLLAQNTEPVANGPVPNENQMRWHEMEYYAFIHFSINTFTDQEWGDGGNKPEMFNPTALDCRQWARVC